MKQNTAGSKDANVNFELQYSGRKSSGLNKVTFNDKNERLKNFKGSKNQKGFFYIGLPKQESYDFFSLTAMDRTEFMQK